MQKTPVSKYCPPGVEGGDRVDIRATSLQLLFGVQAASDDGWMWKANGRKKGEKYGVFSNENYIVY